MHSLKIIIGDSDAGQRKELKKMLNAMGHVVVGEASNSLETLKILRRLTPDLAFITHNSTLRDGEHVAEIIEEEKLCAVILLVEPGYVGLYGRSENETMIPYLRKPVLAATLEPIVNIAVSRFREIIKLEEEINKLKDTIMTRKLVEKAKGLLMSHQGLSETEAFRRIQKQAMNKRTSIKSIAQAIILAYGA
ncbi:ANTAR domain-containing protein [Heliorestis acidaminivorans]|uniref:Stage 0 sporulation protein A homolog n=1 Tax=Heliorestis acidaminivorans TaxID=553427 RepID=A0A6I0F0B4_9FIRM|nr:ANTAR domain-containing protein [Heliorestis acidaminivorans]KAB2953296.1 ANTAR domain-containing protein [Heliorestis acidaminivorans]